MVVPLIGLSLFLGIYPKPVLDRIEPAAQHAIDNFERKTDYRSPEHEKELVHRQKKVEREADEERDHAQRAPKRGEPEQVILGATQPITAPSVDLWGIAPIMALVGAGVGVVLLRALLRRHRLTTLGLLRARRSSASSSPAACCSGSGTSCATTARSPPSRAWCASIRSRSSSAW